MQKRNSIIGAVVVIIVVIIIYISFFGSSRVCDEGHSSLRHLQKYPKLTIDWKGEPLEVWVADTARRMKLGLSGTRCLPGGRGMLFVFPEPVIQKFWMKDMNYPLDIVWLDSDMKEIDRARAVDPQNFPEVVESPVPVNMVLEIPAGSK